MSSKINNFRSYLIVFSFLGILFFPLLNQNFNWLKDIKSKENRTLAKSPSFNVKLLDPFPEKYEKYFNDHFTLRNRLIQSFNLLNIKCFNISPVKDIIIGKNGWLFMGKQENDAFMGKDAFNKDQLDSITQELIYRKSFLEKRNCVFYIMIAPTKASIYPEFLQSTLFERKTNTWGQQLNTHLKRNTSINIIDLHNEMRQQKEKKLLYYKTDNHWTELGAFFGANALLKKVKKDFKSISTLKIKDFNIRKFSKKNGNIVRMLASTNLFKDTEYAMTPKKGFNAKITSKSNYPCPDGFPYCWDYENVKKIKNSNQPKILIISDSFGENFFSFVAEKFSKTVKIFDAWKYELNELIVENEKPDIYVLLVLESNLKSLLK